MSGATQQMLDRCWRGGGRHNVYADFNALTLQITTDALFGESIPAEQAAEVTGVAVLAATLHTSICCTLHGVQR